MKLKISRSQKKSGVVNKHVIFCIDARAELTPDEADDVKKYELGTQVVYNSEASKRHLDKADGHIENSGIVSSLLGFVRSLFDIVKGFVRIAMSKMSLNITIDSLVKGHHIEAKSLDELLGAEEAIKQACENTKGYLRVAATFDGKEEVIEY